MWKNDKHRSRRASQMPAWHFTGTLGEVTWTNMYFLVSCNSIANALASAACERCKSGFAATEKIVNSNGELYHEHCFVCAQCFQQFPEGLFYEVVHAETRREPFHKLINQAVCCTWTADLPLRRMFWMFLLSEIIQTLFLSQFEGRKYCEHDFQILFAPCCHQCGECYKASFIFFSCLSRCNNVGTTLCVNIKILLILTYYLYLTMSVSKWYVVFKWFGGIRLCFAAHHLRKGPFFRFLEACVRFNL